MIDWPTVDELMQVLDVENAEDWEGAETSGEGPTRLTRLLEAAIARVKTDVGQWDDDTDFPDANLSQAALRMAELIALKPEVAASLAGSNNGLVAIAGDPVYRALLVGRRKRFGIS